MWHRSLTYGISLAALAVVACKSSEPTEPAPDLSPPYHIYPYNGIYEVMYVDSAVVHPPIVLVHTAAEFPVAGVRVTFRVTGGGGTIGEAPTTSVTVTSDANGYARISRWTMGPTPMTNTLTITAESAPDPLTMTANGVMLLPPMDPLSTISAGHGHTCGLTMDGDPYCWGSNEYGQIGNGQPMALPVVAQLPSLVAGALKFSTIASGKFHTCGLTAAGAAYCWGANTFGQLGDGTTTNRNVPVAVKTSLRFVSIHAGNGWTNFADVEHTCALTAQGAAYCWGYNGDGAFGNGNFASATTPVPAGSGLAFRSLTVGGRHTCGITTDDKAYCWGFNTSGQLGVGALGASQAAPTPVNTQSQYKSISGGVEHTCAVTTAGMIECWGSNESGELGDGARKGHAAPLPITSGLVFTSVVTGFFHTCGLTVSGDAYCWGWNFYGQLGFGRNSEFVTSPSLVSGGLKFKLLTASGAFTCGLTDSGAAYCWGDAAWGSIGVGYLIRPGTPERVRKQVLGT